MPGRDQDVVHRLITTGGAGATFDHEFDGFSTWAADAAEVRPMEKPAGNGASMPSARVRPGTRTRDPWVAIRHGSEQCILWHAI